MPPPVVSLLRTVTLARLLPVVATGTVSMSIAAATLPLQQAPIQTLLLDESETVVTVPPEPTCHSRTLWPTTRSTACEVPSLKVSCTAPTVWSAYQDEV